MEGTDIRIKNLKGGNSTLINSINTIKKTIFVDLISKLNNKIYYSF